MTCPRSWPVETQPGTDWVPTLTPSSNLPGPSALPNLGMTPACQSPAFGKHQVGQLAVTPCCHQGALCKATTSAVVKMPQNHRARTPVGWGVDRTPAQLSLHKDQDQGSSSSPVLFGPQLDPQQWGWRRLWDGDMRLAPLGALPQQDATQREGTVSAPSPLSTSLSF